MNKIMKMFSTAVFASAVSSLAYAQNCSLYEEKNGLVIMEAENTTASLGQWLERKTISGYKGDGHIEFMGNGSNGGPATSPLNYEFTVSQSGDYRLLLRAHKRLDGAASDKNNDAYVRLEGDYQSTGATALNTLRSNTKLFGGAPNGWGWAETLDLGNHNFKTPIYRLTAGRPYSFVMSGRSIKFNVDRIILFNASRYSLAQAKNQQNVAETCKTNDSGNASSQVVPGRIEAEDYANYYDTTSGNAGSQYRNDSVDIQATTDASGDYNVGWVDSNEWLEYPIDVAQSGNYEAQVRVASQPGNGMFTLEIDGQTRGDAFNVASTGGWQNWQTQSTSLGYLNAGDQTLRVQVQSGGFNINWINLERTGGNIIEGDQCDFTAQCKNIFGDSATDCANSRSENSICMCGSSPCQDSVPSPTPVPTSTPTNTPTPFPTPTPLPVDQCNLTSECKTIFGNQATDCANSTSSQSICMCGSTRCDELTDPGNPGNPGQMLGRFDLSKDMLLANFDGKPDPDDIHSVAGLGTMLLDARFNGINYHAVAGAIGHQGGRFINAPGLFNMAFGNNWSDANANWNNALNEVTPKVINTLRNGGDIWVQEAGQSDFTADLVKRVKQQLSNIDTKTRIHVVQHSNWNEDKTTPADLTYVKQNTQYNKIADGNSNNNGTPGLNTKNGSEWNRAVTDAQAGTMWSEARRVANAAIGVSGYDNPSIVAGGFDFSDCVEDLWIFGFENMSGGVGGFFNEFL